jgi:hypothetical protein
MIWSLAQIPWEQLPPEVQQYDIDAIKLIPELVALQGEVICHSQNPLPEMGIARPAGGV